MIDQEITTISVEGIVKANYTTKALTTTSMDIAKLYEKEHFNVLQAIDNAVKDLMKVDPDGCNSSFQFTSVDTPMPNGGTRKDRVCTMDWKGFNQVALAFTGPKAAAYRWAFINEFDRQNKMCMQFDQWKESIALKDQERKDKALQLDVTKFEAKSEAAKLKYRLKKLEDRVAELEAGGTYNEEQWEKLCRGEVPMPTFRYLHAKAH